MMFGVGNEEVDNMDQVDEVDKNPWATQTLIPKHGGYRKLKGATGICLGKVIGLSNVGG